MWAREEVRLSLLLMSANAPALRHRVERVEVMALHVGSRCVGDSKEQSRRNVGCVLGERECASVKARLEQPKWQ